MSAYTAASLPESTRAPEAKTINNEGTDVRECMSFHRLSLLDEEKTHEMEAGAKEAPKPLTQKSTLYRRKRSDGRAQTAS